MNSLARRSAALTLAIAGLAVPASAAGGGGATGDVTIINNGAGRLETVLRWGSIANVAAPKGRVSGTLRYRGSVVARGSDTSDGITGTGVKLRFTKAARKRLRRVEAPVKMRLTVTSVTGDTASSTVKFR